MALSISLFAAPASAEELKLPVDRCRIVGNNTAGAAYRFEDSGHNEDWSKFVKPIGKVRLLVLPMDFEDVPAKKAVNTELNFMREVEKFFLTNSQKKMQLEVDSSMDWVRMPKTATYYKKAFWAEKINDAIDLVDPIVDFSKYDMVLFYISKYNKITTEAGALPGFPDRTPDGLSQIRGVYLGNDYWRQQGHHAGVTVHEMLHVFGLPDLYMPNKDGSKNVGVFDLMSEYTPKLGMRLFYWHRWKLGWLDDPQVICLDPGKSHIIKIDKTNSANALWVVPISETELHVIQPWVVGKTISAIAYRVNPKDFVWNSAGLQGSGESPIQMLRPARAGNAPKSYTNQNLKVVLRNKDTLRANNHRYTVALNSSVVTLRVLPTK